MLSGRCAEATRAYKGAKAWSAKRTRSNLKGSNGFRQYGAEFTTAPTIKKASGLSLNGARRNSKDAETMTANKTYPEWRTCPSGLAYAARSPVATLCCCGLDGNSLLDFKRGEFSDPVLEGLR